MWVLFPYLFIAACFVTDVSECLIQVILRITGHVGLMSCDHNFPSLALTASFYCGKSVLECGAKIWRKGMNSLWWLSTQALPLFLQGGSPTCAAWRLSLPVCAHECTHMCTGMHVCACVSMVIENMYMQGKGADICAYGWGSLNVSSRQMGWVCMCDKHIYSREGDQQEAGPGNSAPRSLWRRLWVRLLCLFFLCHKK